MHVNTCFIKKIITSASIKEICLKKSSVYNERKKIYMLNARIIHINNMKEANEEIRKIDVDADGIPWLAPKALHISMKLENISTYASLILKQEMLGKGGDVAIHRGAINKSVENSDALLMGTLTQYRKLIYKLNLQSPALQQIATQIQSLLEVIENGKPESFECRKYKFNIRERTYIMGILNITPDSFSDGGKFTNIEAAIKYAKEMVDFGADIIDVGGESTRPNHEPIDALTEINRILPIVEHLSKEITVPISIDTSKALVAEKCLDAGASIINDVWGLKKDPDMADVISKHGAGLIIMHNQDKPDYNDLMGEIIKDLRNSLSIAQRAGIRKECIVVDPGIGFGKTLEHNLEIMRRLKELDTLNLPVLIGTSRKSMIGNILDLPINERLEGTAATVTLAISNNVDIIRIHDVKEMTKVARMTDAIVRSN